MRLSRRSLILVALLALAAPASLAGPEKKEGGHGKSESEAASAEEKEVARSIMLGGLVFPVFTDEGKLKNYIFVDARMLVAPGKDPWKYRNQAHLIRDAVVRVAHRTSFGAKDDYTKLNQDLAAKECLKAANEAVGESGVLVSMTFTQIASQIGR